MCQEISSAADDWLTQPRKRELILQYLEENEELFGISIERDLLTVDGKILDPSEVFRKVEPTSLQELT